jgi:2,4-diaminopentanoate dehydrogenase
MTLRVVQWGTGNVGRRALGGIVHHPDLELVGLVVHDSAKNGLDAGELCGLERIGVAATTDIDAALATQPDCVAYFATADLRPHEAVADIEHVLRSGSNVVSTSIVSLVYPPAADPAHQAALESACRDGNASCFTSGIDPGFANDLVPLMLSGFCERVDSVRISEILDYSTYDQPKVLFETMGFGQPLDSQPLLLLPGSLTYAWGGVVEMLAAGLGVELDRIDEWHERWPAPRDVDCGIGVVREATMAALRFEVRGVRAGRDAIVVEHVTRMYPDAAPEWPQPAGEGSYRVMVEGSPTIKVELELVGIDGDHNDAGLLATAMRVLNAVPAVCAAEPGLLSPLDLPLVTGRGLMP